MFQYHETLIVSKELNLKYTNRKMITMKKRIIYNLLVFFYLIISPFVLNAMIGEYEINGILINHEGIDLDDLSITATKVLPTGQQTVNVKIKENGEFSIRGNRFKELNQIWLEFDELYYGELLVSEELVITFDVAQLTKSSVYMVGKGVEFSGVDAIATILTNEWRVYKQEQQLNIEAQINGVSMIKELDSLFAIWKIIEDEFILQNLNEPIWILKDKRLSEYFNQLFLIVDRQNIDWKFLNEAIAYKPRIMGNSGQLYYNYQSWILMKIVIGSNIKDCYLNMKENLNRLDLETRDFVIMAALPDEIERREEFVIEFLPLVDKSWAKELLTVSLNQARLELRN